MATYDENKTQATQIGETQLGKAPNAGIILTPSTPPPPTVAHSAKNVGWEAVAIGGTAGILIGGAAMLATSLTAEASKPEIIPTEDLGETESLEIAPPEIPTETEASQPSVTVVSGGLSFSEAFREARAEVGPGGVFTWHGGVYSTYTADEWDAMSIGERDTYVHSISPSVYAEAAQDHSVNHSHVHHVDVDHSQYHAEGNAVHISEDSVNDYDEGVRFLGISAIGENEDGSTNYAGIATIDGHTTILANTDGDAENTFDQMWVDINDNENVEYGEVADISDLGMTAGDFATLAESPIMPEESIGACDVSAPDDYTTQFEISNDIPNSTDEADLNFA